MELGVVIQERKRSMECQDQEPTLQIRASPIIDLQPWDLVIAETSQLNRGKRKVQAQDNINMTWPLMDLHSQFKVGKLPNKLIKHQVQGLIIQKMILLNLMEGELLWARVQENQYKINHPEVCQVQEHIM